MKKKTAKILGYQIEEAQPNKTPSLVPDNGLRLLAAGK